VTQSVTGCIATRTVRRLDTGTINRNKKPPQPFNHGPWRLFHACWKSPHSLLYSAKALEMNLS